MIVQKEFLNKLKDFGLNSYESKLWTALLSRGVSTAGELSDIANVPRSRSYDVLESLERKGFIITKLGKPIKYIAVQPSAVVERVQKKIVEDAEKQHNAIESLKGSEILTELQLLHSKGIEMIEPAELTGAIRGRTNITDHMETMIKHAEKSVVLITSEEGLVRKSELFRAILSKPKHKNVRVTVLAPITKSSQKAADALRDIATVKHTPESLGRYLLVDGREVLFMLMPEKTTHPSYDVGIWVCSPFFAQSLEKAIVR
ncbi:TrmB family transcriptional regulator [Candidatus Woesearchaeota archaeon]|nr:TrmB family transcriptional regulator [Candidatus Woesearchaeota archaeon]